MKKVKPAIYDGPWEWGWCLLSELSEVVGQRADDIWVSYFDLNREAKYGMMPVVLPGTDRVIRPHKDGTDRTCAVSVTEAIKSGNLFVPAGWAVDVLCASTL